MEGHYHLELAPDDDSVDYTEDDNECNCHNGTLEEIKRVLDSSNRDILHIGFICTYGCGVLHNLTEDDKVKLGVVGERGVFTRVKV